MMEVRSLVAGHGGMDVVHDVDLSVDRGQVVSLLGPNGAGKSTIAACISGLLRPSGGQIVLDGTDMTRMRPERRVALGLAMVPESRALFPGLSVRDNLLLGSFRRGRTERDTSLESVHALFPRLDERATQDAGSLSGGEQQMLAIGRALMSQPDFLVLDEPSLGLAPLVVRTIIEKVRDLADSGIGVLLVEQNAAQALEISDRAIIIERGRTVLQGTADQLRDDGRVASSYLGGRI